MKLMAWPHYVACSISLLHVASLKYAEQSSVMNGFARKRLFVSLVSPSCAVITNVLSTDVTGGACSLIYGPARYTEDRGQIVSPNYPYNYYNDAECRWLITATGLYHVSE